MTKAKLISKSFGAKIAAGTSMAVASVGAFAVDHTTAINAAGTDAQGNVTAAVLVIVGILAIVTGIGVIRGLLGK